LPPPIRPMCVVMGLHDYRLGARLPAPTTTYLSEALGIPADESQEHGELVK
jgi:hypothetical protein